MQSKNLLNWKQVSLFLTNSDNNIRKNKIPKKHKEKINELELLISFWVDKNK